MSHKFVIIDGNSLTHRAFYALPLLSSASGQYTNAVYGFATMLVKLITDIKPNLVVAAFDKGKATIRIDKFAEYKAHRKAAPPELREQFPLIREMMNAFNIPVLECEGFEADDIIGTIAHKAAKENFDVIIVTGDRDALQLIGANTKVMLTKKGISEMELYGDKEFRDKYGVAPKQLVDLKGLMGDSSDNIPGVSGIGEKTAIKLIKEFGTIENLINNVDRISGKKLQENIRNNTDIAILSKQLATIVCDMDIDFRIDAFKFEPERKKVEEFFLKFEFKSLLNRIDKIFTESKSDVIDLKLPAASIMSSGEDVDSIIHDSRQTGNFIFFPIVSGKVPLIEFEGMAVMHGDTAVYVPKTIPGWEKIIALIADCAITKITYNVKSIHAAFLQKGERIHGRLFDVLLAAYLLDPTASEYPIQTLNTEYLGKDAMITENSFESKQDYAVWACQSISELYHVLDKKLIDTELDDLFYKIELPLAEVLAATENTGVKVDIEQLEQMNAEITQKVEMLLAEIYALAGEKFNVNSPKKLGALLFDKLKLPVVKKTKTGYSTDAEVLEKLRCYHPVVDKLLEYRMLTKLKSTYLDGLRPLINFDSKRIHTTFNQTVTATGRLSSSEPNLQNIPIRTDIGRRIRKLFIPGQTFKYIMSADYSQIELRILAHMSGDNNLISAFKANEDIHTRTASKVFGVPIEKVTAEMRARAKAVNFGIVYGISDYGLSRDIGVSRNEAAQYIANYFERYSGVRNFINTVIESSRKLGFVTTMLGRRRYLPDINSSNFNKRSFAERTAINTPIQGTAADIIKKAMIDVYRQLCKAKLKSRILLQVHDELVLEVMDNEVDIVADIVKQTMENVVKLEVPLIVDVKIGDNWAEAK